jgi:hypothetical protein
MSWLRRFAMRSAARTYARRLPAILVANWGASRFYTAGQIKSALAQSKLRTGNEAVAYAAYLSAEDYCAIEPKLKTPYEEARKAFESYRPWRSAYAHEAVDTVGGVGAGGPD